MEYGFEVEWVSAYKPDKRAEEAGDFDWDGCVYSSEDFESRYLALKFARRIRRRAVAVKIAWIREFREQPGEYAPGVTERVYIVDTEEII